MGKRGSFLLGLYLGGLGLVSVLSLARAGAGTLDPGRSLGALPSPFLMLPARPASVFFADLEYNSRLDRYVAIYRKTSKFGDGLYSRLYDSKGRPTCALATIKETKASEFGTAQAAYNPEDDTFLCVGTDGANDEIQGIELDGMGRLRGEWSTILIKAKTKKYSVGVLNVVWAAAIRKFVVSWTAYAGQGSKEPDRGIYLALIDGSFKKTLGPKRITAIDRYACVCPLDDKLFWGSSEKAGPLEKPVVWFTDFKGRVLTNYGANGFLYPGPGDVCSLVPRAERDPDHDVIFFYWRNADAAGTVDWTYSQYLYRIIGADGQFKSPACKLPKVEPFHTWLLPQYIPEEKRFFLVATESQIAYQRSPYRLNSGSKLWGFYMNDEGRLQDKKGNYVVDPIPLTRKTVDPKLATFGGAIAYRPRDRSVLVTYRLSDLMTHLDEIWGLIHK